MSEQFFNDQILVTGASSLLGQAVCKVLNKRSIQYIVTSRRKEDLSDKTIYMDLESGKGIKEAIFFSLNLWQLMPVIMKKLISLLPPYHS